jgi:hypothetical protein
LLDVMWSHEFDCGLSIIRVGSWTRVVMMIMIALMLCTAMHQLYSSSSVHCYVERASIQIPTRARVSLPKPRLHMFWGHRRDIAIRAKASCPQTHAQGTWAVGLAGRKFERKAFEPGHLPKHSYTIPTNMDSRRGVVTKAQQFTCKLVV